MAATPLQPRRRSATLAKKPAVALDTILEIKPDGLSAAVTVNVTSRSAQVEKKPLLVCAVLREDGVITDIPAGENAGKSLVARYPARLTKYDFIELDGKSPVAQKFAFTIKPSWNADKLRLAVFVQDKRSGTVHQATDLAWRSTQIKRTRSTSDDR